MRKAERSIKARSPPASFTFKGQATEHTTVEWPINFLMLLTQRQTFNCQFSHKNVSNYIQKHFSQIAKNYVFMHFQFCFQSLCMHLHKIITFPYIERSARVFTKEESMFFLAGIPAISGREHCVVLENIHTSPMEGSFSTSVRPPAPLWGEYGYFLELYNVELLLITIH